MLKFLNSKDGMLFTRAITLAVLMGCFGLINFDLGATWLGVICFALSGVHLLFAWVDWSRRAK